MGKGRPLQTMQSRQRHQQSEFIERFVSEHLGISTDDPCFQYVVTQLFGTHRRGLLPTDPALLRRFVADVRTRFYVEQEREAAARAKCWVYYLRIGEHIKIGTARNLSARLVSYPPSTVVLAVERGSYELEAERLAQFAPHLAARKEWFHPHPDLLAHIDRIADRDTIATALAERQAM